MNVLLIGGTGLLGSETARELLERGHDVVSIALHPLPEGALLPARMQLILGNVMEMSDTMLESHLQKCEGLIFAAGVDERVVGPAPIYDLFERYNITPLRRLLQLASKAGIRHAVVLGSYFTHFNRVWADLALAYHHPYIRSRVDQEQMALGFVNQGSLEDVAVLELPYIFGAQPGRKPVWLFLTEAIEQMKGVTCYPHGGSTMVTVRQVAQAAVGALERNKGGQYYPIGYDNLTWKVMLRIVHRAMGVPNKPIITIPKWLYQQGMRALVQDNQQQGHEPGLDPMGLAEIMTRQAFIDPSVASEPLGVQPDNIEQAIGASIELCLAIMQRHTTALAMKGE